MRGPSGPRARTIRPSGREPELLHQVADRPALCRGPSVPDQRAPPPHARSRTVRPYATDRPRLTREHRRRFFLSIWRSEKASTYFLATPLGITYLDLSNRPSMAGSRDSSDISPSNIIEPTWDTLSADEQLQFEEHKEQMIQEAKARFLANFKVDRNNKVVRHRATDPASLRPTPDIPNVSNTNEMQSLKNYVDEHREQMQNIIGDMQNDYRRLARAFDKSSIANFPSHEVELGGNTRNTSVVGCHDQSQPLYGMPMDTYPEQPQIGSKTADLHMPGPSARERGPSGPVMVGPIFNEVPRHAPEPPHMT
jgi:hypothetical protein